MKNVNVDAMLRDLPASADKAMGGLTATPYMWAKIERAASGESRKAVHRVPRWTYACSAAALVLVMVLALLPGVGKLGDANVPAVHMNHGMLGEATPLPDSSLTADLGGGVFIAKSTREPGFRSIWAESRGGSWPMVGVNGSFYRLLTSPGTVDASLLGAELGTVAEFTTEPSLSGTDVLLSNTAPYGTAVHAIRGMDGALVAAQVDGAWRVFQRVSFNGNALRGSEKLADTLHISGRVIAMELSGVGAITDETVCAKLADTLLKNATFDSSGSISSKQSLLIELDSGLVLQMAVRGDKLAACGVWSCPEFLEAFEEAVK